MPDTIIISYRLFIIIKKGQTIVLFAVVKFAEPDKFGICSVATVPTNWIFPSQNNIFCKWPKKFKSCVEKRKEPQANWDYFAVDIIAEFETLPEAKKKEILYAVTSDTDEVRSLGKGKRKKYVSNHCRTITPPPKVQITETIETDTTDTSSTLDGDLEINQEDTDGRRKSKCFKIDNENVSTKNISKLMNKFMSKFDDTRYLQCSTDSDAQKILETNEINEVPLLDSNKRSTENEGNISDLSYSLHDETDDVVEPEATNRIILKYILKLLTQQKILNDRFTSIERYISQHIGIPIDAQSDLSNLPLKTEEDLKDLEEKLQNEKVKAQLILFTARIGGVDKRNCVRSALARIFTNSLGMKCSWTGQKQNIRLKDYKLMNYIKEGIRTNVVITDAEYETILMEWFRYAKIRFQRKNQ